MAKYEYFKAFTRAENTPEKLDPGMKILEGQIQIRNKDFSAELQGILREAADEAEVAMKKIVPVRSGALKRSIRVVGEDPNLPFFRGGFAGGVGANARGRGAGGVSRVIEVRAGGPSTTEDDDPINVDYVESVLEGQLAKKLPEGQYFVFDPYKTRPGANKKYFRKNLQQDTRTSFPYKSSSGVVFSTSRRAFKGNRAWLDAGVAAANRVVGVEYRRISRRAGFR